MLVELFDNPQSVGTLRRATPSIAEDSDVDTRFILLLEQAVEVENRLGGLRMEPTLWHEVSVAIDDHEKDLLLSET
jgi:hypothetical protein